MTRTEGMRGRLGMDRGNASGKILEPRADRAFHLVNYCVLALFAISVLYPLIYVLSSSVSAGSAIRSGEVKLWPVGLNFDAYRTIFSARSVTTGLLNSIIYAVAGAAIGTVLTVLAGYPLSRSDLPLRRTLMFFFLIPTLFSAGFIPTYVIVQRLGLMNTRWAILLPGAMSVFNVIITRAYYQLNVPNELLDAARVDGADDFRFLWHVALPLSKPIIAVNLLFYAIAQWNGWFGAMLYLTDPSKMPFQLVLRDILALGAVNDFNMTDAAQLKANQELFDKLRYAVMVVAMVPPLLIYPLVQKQFVKGALIGSLK